MKLAEYHHFYRPVAKQTTLVFLRRGDEILLAMKKRGFGAGKWNGPGGKVELGETVAKAAAREVHEEIGVEVKALEEAAHLSFYFLPDPHDEVHNIVCTVYVCREWAGEPSESEEMAPRWYQLTDIPYMQMWEDDQYWLPKMLAGQYVEGEFLFDEGDVMRDMRLKIA